MPGERLRARLVDQPVGQRHQMRLVLPSRVPALAPAVNDPISTRGCAEQQPEQLPACISGGSRHRDPIRHGMNIPKAAFLCTQGPSSEFPTVGSGDAQEWLRSVGEGTSPILIESCTGRAEPPRSGCHL